MNYQLDEHNRGQIDGAHSTFVEQFVTEWSPLVSSAYRQGFRHAARQQNSQRPSTSVGGGGAGPSAGEAWPIWLILGLAAAVIVLPLVLLWWGIKRPARFLVVSFLAASVTAVWYTGAVLNNDELLLPFFNFMLAAAAATAGYAIGEPKGRAIAGFLLGFFASIIGIIIIACMSPASGYALDRDA